MLISADVDDPDSKYVLVFLHYEANDASGAIVCMAEAALGGLKGSGAGRDSGECGVGRTCLDITQWIEMCQSWMILRIDGILSGKRIYELSVDATGFR